MKSQYINLNKLIICTIFSFSGLSCSADTINGTVVSVTDGDTVTLLDELKVQHKIRLAGIDAPEKKQAFGMRSKDSLSDLVYKKQVIIETNKTDRYGREIGVIFVYGKDANLEQVNRGFAWHYKAYQREQSANDRRLYEYAEREARAVKKGLWIDANPTPPWEFRHVKK